MQNLCNLLLKSTFTFYAVRVLRACHQLYLRQKKAPRWDGPVCVVGSLQIGGGGRTALVQRFSQELSTRAIPHRILCLDFHQSFGKTTHLRRVHRHQSWEQATDEALLLAEKTDPRFSEVWLCTDRVEALNTLLSQSKHLILVDDGLEDPRLVHATRLRIVKKDEPLAPTTEDLWPKGRFRSLAQKHTGLWIWQETSPQVPGDWGPRRVPSPSSRSVNARLICALGDPKSFRDCCLEAGWTILDFHFAKDHSNHFLPVLNQWLESYPEPILVTAKDAVKIPAKLRMNPKLLVLEEHIVLNFNSFEKLIGHVLNPPTKV
jgi:tetraacyldisaccharide-1-P 4'-kinase